MKPKWMKFSRPDKGESASASSIRPLDPFHAMGSLMEHMMNGRWPSVFGDLTDRPAWFGNFAAAPFQPSLDVADAKTHLKITAELPGVNAEDIELAIEDDCLVIRGEKKQESTKEENGTYRTERSFGSFERWVPLPTAVDETSVEAAFDKGVLTVHIPKLDTVPPKRKIEIKSR